MAVVIVAAGVVSWFTLALCLFMTGDVAIVRTFAVGTIAVALIAASHWLPGMSW